MPLSRSQVGEVSKPFDAPERTQERLVESMFPFERLAPVNHKPQLSLNSSSITYPPQVLLDFRQQSGVRTIIESF